MNDRKDFDICLEDGQIAEEKLRELLTNGSGNVKIEVKRDDKIQNTGNFFFEYESRGEPSGLAVTKSDWWAVSIKDFDDDFIFLFRVPRVKERLRNLLTENRAVKKRGGDKDGGEVGTSKGVVVSAREFFRDTSATS